MTNTLLDMPKPPKNGTKGKTFPSREKVKYAGIPAEYWSLLDGLTADGEKYEGRSVAFLNKIAVRAFLQAEGKLDDKGRPIPPA